jgi:hypothetical protein
MTLITTIVSNYGLIQASDSHVTNYTTGTTKNDPKVFPLGFADGALALSGTYRAGNERMDTWMPTRIAEYGASGSTSIEGFAHYLQARLDAELTATQASDATLIHIVGYERADTIHPVMYFVRNAWSINATTGAYEDIRHTFQVSEDYWGRDYGDDLAQIGPDPTRYRMYFNGTPDGRIAFFQFGQLFRGFLAAVFAQPNWRFRPPRSLDELAAMVELQIRTVATLYVMSDYPAAYVGGEPQVHKIPPPVGAVVL